MKTKKAFSIVELIIVVAVIGILAAVLIPLIGGVVKKANAKSALSDARNALTNYESYMQSNEINLGDVIFIVHKAKGLYVYGLLAGKGSLFESVDNPYELANKKADEVNVADEAQKLLAKLIENGSIAPSPLQNQENITEKVKDVPDTVAVFYGYKLQSFIADISFEKAVVDLAIGDTEQLKVFVNPETEIEYSSSNPEIVSVDENGTVAAKALGTATITAKSGNKVAECTANVIDSVEFNGTMVELKNLFENTGTETVFIRLTMDVMSTDNSLFPLIIPEGKQVRIDFNGCLIFCGNADNPISATTLIKNCGGTFVLGNSEKLGGIIGRYDGSDTEDGYISAIKNEVGTLIIKDSFDIIYTTFDNTVFKDNTACGIDNYDVLHINKHTNRMLDFSYPYFENISDCFFRNAKGGYATLTDTVAQGSIINEGTIELLKGLDLESYMRGIVNNGTILKMENCIIDAYSQKANETVLYSAALENLGIIGDIVSCKFEAHENGSAFIFTSGEVNSIMQCELFGTFTSIDLSESAYFGGFTLTNKLTDGKYSHTVPTSLIASGYSCKAQDDYFVISKD